MRSSRKLQAWLAVVIAALLFVAFNVLSQSLLRGARLDLTEDRLYTLSEGTRTVLSDLDEPLTARFYFSQGLAGDLPTISQYARRVQELLETYASESGGVITLQVIEPEPFSEAEDEAVGFGLQGAPVNAAGDRLYFGLAATNTTDDQEVIPFFQDQREAFLEYDLTRAFYNLANPKRPVVGLISTLPLAGSFDPQQGFSQPWAIARQIEQLFTLEDLGTSVAEVPETVDVLMVVHPKDLPDATRYAIDQYVLRGGHALVFVDPFSEAAAGRPNPDDPVRLHNSSLPDLFAAWGVTLEPGMVVADRLAARRVRTGPPDRPVPVDYVAWLTLDQRNMNRDEVVTSELGVVNLATAGALTAAEDAATSFVPLLTSSPVAMLIERIQVQFVPDPQQLLADFQATGAQYVMAARLTGPVKSAFPDGPPGAAGNDADGADADADADADDNGADGAGDDADGHLAESSAPANLILVADSDVLADRSWVQVQDFLGQSFAVPLADNGAMVVNALDALAGSGDLISLRSRGTSARPFEVVVELRRQAEDRFRETEQMLQAQITETEQKLADLQTGAGEGGQTAVLTPEQGTAIAEFREQLVASRKQLRDVQLALRRDIESLGVLLKFLNIGLVPLVIGLAAVVVSVIRRQRRKRVMGLA